MRFLIVDDSSTMRRIIINTPFGPFGSFGSFGSFGYT